MQRPIVRFPVDASGSICHHLQSLQYPHELLIWQVHPYYYS